MVHLLLACGRTDAKLDLALAALAHGSRCTAGVGHGANTSRLGLSLDGRALPTVAGDADASTIGSASVDGAGRLQIATAAATALGSSMEHLRVCIVVNKESRGGRIGAPRASIFAFLLFFVTVVILNDVRVSGCSRCVCRLLGT